MLDHFCAAVDAVHITHDKDGQEWALQAQKGIVHVDVQFKASKYWVSYFKKSHKIGSKKINKFVTKKTHEEAENLKSAANKCIAEVKQIIQEKELESVFNSDQRGFQSELKSRQTLSVEGQQQNQCLVESVTSATHSYTIQPTISGDGKLLSPLFVALQERSGAFGPAVQETLFQPSNIYLTVSKSGKLISYKKDFILCLKWYSAYC